MILLLCSVIACDKYEVRRTKLTENGYVVTTSYMPARHGTTGDNIAIGFNGKLSYVPATTVHFAEASAVVFRCEHGSFTIKDKKWLYDRLAGCDGKAVEIEYTQEETRLVDDKGKVLKDWHVTNIWFNDATLK